MFIWNQYAITASETEKDKQNEQGVFISKTQKSAYSGQAIKQNQQRKSGG